MLVEGQQPVHAIAVELLKLVDLVVHRPRVAQVLVGGVRRVLVGHVDGDLRAVGQEQPAQHAVKRRKPMERVAARVHADEGVTLLHPADEAFAIGNRQITGGVREDHRIDLGQIGHGKLLTDFVVVLAVGSAPHVIHHGEITGGFTKRRDDVLGGGDGAVAEALGGGDHEDLLRRSRRKGHRRQQATGYEGDGVHERMKTGDGIHRTSQSEPRKRKPLEKSNDPFSTTIAEDPVHRTIAVIRRFRQFRAIQRPSLPLRIGASHERNPPSGTCVKALLPHAFGTIGGWLLRTSA